MVHVSWSTVAPYSPCAVDHFVNIDLTVHSRPDSRKSGTMLHIGVVDMRTTQQQDCVVLTYEPLHMPSSRSTVYVKVAAVFRTPPS